MLGALVACGASPAPAPLENHGGRVVPDEPPVVTLDSKQLMSGGLDLVRATPVTLVIGGSSYGLVVVDGKAIGTPPIRQVFPAGKHHIAIQIEDY
jgi:hypothetical protein